MSWNMDLLHLVHLIYVTGFGKTDHECTRFEIHFIACYNSHTQALSRHSDTTAIDKKVCFYRWLLPTLSSHAGPSQTLWGHWLALIRWYVVPNCSIQHLLPLWYGKGCCGHLSGPLCTQFSRLCLRASLNHPPSPSTLLFVASVIFQALFKMSLKISQSIQ